MSFFGGVVTQDYVVLEHRPDQGWCREAPQPVLESFVHGWGGERFEVVARFGTSGGTDAAAFAVDGVRHLAVSNSLDASLRFRADTCIYRIETN